MPKTKKGNTHATGPVTPQGKARASMNAVRHGALASRLLVPGENPAEYAALVDAMQQELRPVGALEHVLVENIVAVMWRKKRLDGAEVGILSWAQMQPVEEGELTAALGLDQMSLPRWMFSGYVGDKTIKPLPGWMLSPGNAPTDAAGKQAARRYATWAKQNPQAHAPSLMSEMDDDERQSAMNFEVLRKAFDRRIREAEGLPPEPENQELTQTDVKSPPPLTPALENDFWVSFCYEHRDQLAAAFQAIQTKRMMQEWDLDLAHRYHTQLDNQLIRWLREFRETRAWRLQQLELVNRDDAQPEALRSATTPFRASKG